MDTTLSQPTPPFPRYMMATIAHHQLGDISRDTPDLCVVQSETPDEYIGHWVMGLGFIGVRFPKATTHELTPADADTYKDMRVGMYSLLTGEKSYDCGVVQL